MSNQILVVAIGGNSLIKDAQHMSVPDQMLALGETSNHIARIIKDGWHVAIGHGNGPQVGFILRRSGIAKGVSTAFCGKTAGRAPSAFGPKGIDRH
mgnify:CR=1 FL=1